MLITIYDSVGNPKVELSPNDSSTQVKEVQGDSVLTLSFTHYEHIELDVDDYADFLGERFWLTEKYRPKQNSRKEWVYDLKLYGVESMIKRLLVIKTVDGEEDPVFTLTAPPRDHVAMIVKCMNNGMGNITDWKVGQVNGTENIVIDYFGKYCDEALKEIAEKVGAEWWVEGQTVNICKCEHGEPVHLGYDKGLTSIDPDTADNVKFYTRLYPVGSSRNIDREKYGYTRLQLPGGARYVEINADKYGRVDHYEADAFADIYPRRTGMVSSVRSEVKTGEDGNPFTIYYFTDNSLPFDPNDYEIGGLVKRVSFQEGSELAGLGEEENGTYYFEVNYNSKTREFEIITIWPYDNDVQLPGDKLVPKAGDKYILWNLRMPDEYYALAEEEFLAAVNAYNAEHNLDISVYKAPTDHVWIEETGVELTIGRRVRLESAEYFPGSGYRDSRITKITRKVNLPSSMDIEISDALSRTTQEKMADSIADVRSYAKSIGESVSLPDIIRTGDSTRATDNNLLSALRTYRDLLRKDRPDSTPYDLTSKGLLTGGKGLHAGDFRSGICGGALIIEKESGQSYAEVDRLLVRMKAYFEELTIINSSSIGGKKYVTPGGSVRISEVEDVLDGNGNLRGWRCWYLSEQDGEKTDCFLKAGDQGICKFFNAKEGTTNGVSNTYYWRKVTGVNPDGGLPPSMQGKEDLTSTNRYGWFELSATDCESPDNDIPQGGDVVTQLGYNSGDAADNARNRDRQTAIVLSAVGDADAPSVKLFSGIDSYSLEGKDIVGYGYDPVRGNAYFRCYGDMYLGDRDGSTFVRYDMAGRKLTINADLEVGSTIGGSSIGDYIRNLDLYRSTFEALGADMTAVEALAKGAQDSADSAQDSADAALSASQGALATAEAAKAAEEQLRKTIAGYDYLKEALLNGKTLFNGGLMLSSQIRLGEWSADKSRLTTYAGINGIAGGNARAIASWWGGDMADLFDSDDNLLANPPANAAASLVRMDGSYYFSRGNIMGRTDGSGWIAGGNISWDASGRITVGSGVTFDITNVKGLSDTLSSITATLTGWDNLFVPVEKDINGNLIEHNFAWAQGNPGKVYAIKVKVGFYSERFVTALGLNADGTVSGGGLDMEALNNVLKDYALKKDIPSLAGYLTKTSAASTYLTKTDAASLYQPKGDYLVKHQTIYALTFAAGAFSTKTYTPNTGAQTVNIPTNTSHIAESGNLYFTNARAVAALKTVTDGLASDIASVNSSLTAKIDSVNTTLTTKINDVSTKLTTKINSVEKKVDDFKAEFDKIFTPEWSADGKLISIKANAGLWTDQYLSALGKNPDGTTSGGGIDAEFLENYLKDYALKKEIPSLTGYATQSWVNAQGFLKSVSWGAVSGKPGWIGSSKPSYQFSELTSTPTTLSGYGITDAKIVNGVITLGENTITPVTDISGKVDKEAGKGLSSNDFTDTLLTKLNGIEAGANKYIHPTDGANTTIAAVNGKVISSITVNNLGHVTAVGSKTLVAADIPNLAISKITGLRAELDSKLDKSTFNSVFEIEKDSKGNITAIKAKYGFYSIGFVTALGQNPDGTISGGGIDAEFLENYLKDYALKKEIPSLTGYATQSWVNAQGFLKSVSWSAVSGKPGWIGSSKPSYQFSEIGSTPTTLSGYGITDAKIVNGVITLGGNTITPVTDISGKVDKEAGKGLSSNDFTDTLLTKLNGIEAGANKYIHPTDGANTTIAAVNGKVISSITVNNLGHVTAVGSKTLASADIPNLAISKITGLRAELDSKLDKSTFNSVFEIEKDSKGNITAIKAKYGFYSIGFVTALGQNPDGTTSGGGIDVDFLQNYLDGKNNNHPYKYATESWVGGLFHTLTIQKNGTTVGTFNPKTANATINLTDVASASTLSSHTSNKTVHITAAERTKWNTGIDTLADLADNKADKTQLEDYLKIDGSNGTAAGLTAMINMLPAGDSNVTDNTLFVTSHASTPAGNNYYRRSATFLWDYIKGKANAVYQPIGSYVTTNTEQNIRAKKTFTSDIVMGTSHYIYGAEESSGAMIHFDGTRTIIGSVGASSTAATHLRSKTGHLTAGANNTASFTVWDSGNDGSGSGLDADLLDGTHKSGLLTAFNRLGDINNKLGITVGGTTKEVSLYPLSSWGLRYVSKDDNGGKPVLVLIADVSAWKGSSKDAAHHGFIGRIVESRTGGYMGEKITDVICRVGYQDANGTSTIHLRTSNPSNVRPKIVSYNSKTYIGFLLYSSGHSCMMEGMFHGCLSTFIQLACTDSNGTMPSGVTDLTGSYTVYNYVSFNAKLETRKLWGNDFDGTGNVGGTMTFNADGDQRQLSISIAGAIKLKAGTGGWAWGLSSIKRADSASLGFSAGAYGQADTLKYHFYGGSYSSPSAVILPTGNMGIGLTNPAYKLEVNGTAKVTKLIIGAATIEWDGSKAGLKVSHGIYSQTYISALGVGNTTAGGGLSYGRYSDWAKTPGDTDVLGANLGVDLNTRVKNLESGSVLKFTTTGTGNAVTSVSKSGTSVTITKDVTFLTSHQSLASYYTKTDANSKFLTAVAVGTGDNASKIGVTKNGTTTYLTVPYATKANMLQNNSAMTYGASGLQWFNISGTAGCEAKVNDTPTSAWWHVLRFNHANSAGYYTDLAVPFNHDSLYWKTVRNGKLAHDKWVKVLDELNYTGIVTKIGTVNVGSGVKPIYLNAGTPTASTSTVGGTAKPVYLNSGTITALSATVGSTTKPVYMNAGTLTALSATAGASNRPVYLNGGELTAVSSVAVGYIGAGGPSRSNYLGVTDVVDGVTANNRFEAIPANLVTVELWNGSAWEAWTGSDIEKQKLFSLAGGSVSAKVNNGTTGNKIRLTVTAANGKIYFHITRLMMNISTNGLGSVKALVEGAKIGSETTYETIGTYGVGGWSGWNTVYLDHTLGGSESQTTQFRKLRITFSGTLTTSEHKTKFFQVFNVLAYGTTCWANTGVVNKWNRPYTYALDTFAATFEGDIKTKSNAAYSLGSSAAIWLNVYTKYVKSNTTLYLDSGASCSTIVSINGTEKARFAQPNGYLGLGITAPTQRIDALGNMRLQSSTSGAGGDVHMELWRGTNASWRILNTSGYLKFQSNYTSTAGSYFDVLQLDYNTGKAWFKNEVIGKSANAFRCAYGTYGAILRTDSSRFWILLTNENEAANGTFNTLRPFSIDFKTGQAIVGHTFYAGGLASLAGGATIPTGKSLKIGSATITWDESKKMLHIDKGVYSDGAVSALGMGTSGTSAGVSYNRYDGDWSNYTSAFDAYVVSGKSGNELLKRIKSLEGGSALSVTTTGSGNAVTAVSKSGTAITVTKGSTFLTTSAASSTYQPKGSYVTLSDAQTIKGVKTFDANVTLAATRMINIANESATITKTSTQAIHGGKDCANADDANLRFGSWQGIGWYPTISGQDVERGKNAMWLNVRTGVLTVAGKFVKSGGAATDFLMADGSVRSVKNNTGKGSLGWTNVTDEAANIPTLNTLAYWNGAYSGTSSNLTYCNKGAFGTMATKNAADYLALAGGTMANTSLVTNMNADLVDGFHAYGTTGRALKKNGYVTSPTKGLSSYWAKLATITVGANAEEHDITIYLHSCYNGIYGTLSLRLRTLTGSTAFQARLLSGNIPADRIRVYYNSTTPNVFELWVNVNAQYGVINALLLSETGRCGNENTTPTVTFHETSFTTVQTASLSAYVTPSYIGLLNNAATATSASQLTTSRNLWGRPFNGTANVTGSLTSVGNITGSGAMTISSTNGRLTLNGAATALDLKFAGDNTKSVILNGSAFKPFDDANNKLTLGSTSARWSTLYATAGDFAGLVRVRSALAISPYDNYDADTAGDAKTASGVSVKLVSTMPIVSILGSSTSPMINIGSYVNNKLYGAVITAGGNDTSSFLKITTAVLDIANGVITTAHSTGSQLKGNQGGALINSTNTAGTFTMLAKLNTTNGYIMHGVSGSTYNFYYTPKSSVDNGTVTNIKTLLSMTEGGFIATGSGMTVGGSMSVNGGLELSMATPFIDFHYGKSTADYTTRLIEEASGKLKLIGTFHTTKGIYSDTYVTAKTASTSSDARLKDIAGRLSLGVKTIAAAPSVFFSWKDDGKRRRHAGTIAQYWKRTLPEVVHTNADGFMSVEYGVLGVMMGISLARTVDVHERRIDRLERENNELRRRVAELEKCID